MEMAQKKLNALLKKMIELGGSDLHIKAGAIARTRINGELTKMGKVAYSKDEMEELAKAILEHKYDEFKETLEADFSYVLDEKSRFRVNMFHQMDGISAVLRIIPIDILTLEDLNFPDAVEDLTKKPRGLVLVTGVTGSGKSTTLAAMIDAINRHKKKHIITLEDPIEFVHQDKSCLINQRGIGQDSRSFANALKAALREDPDIILVGEMRDLETIDIALHAAETGHLVFSTLHTLDAKETVNRVIGMFPEEEQNRIREGLASVLEGVLSQRLVKTIDGKRTAAMEILLKTARVQQLISENRDSEIPDALQEGKDIYGTQTFDQALLDLYFDKRIDKEQALENATNPSDMKLKMQGLGSASSTGGGDQEYDKDEDEGVFDLKEDE
ncbi:MAG: type IV pilus twitching motility protein PilT [Campylobacterota bacterium]